MKNNIYVGLVHHPVYNKNNEVVTTSITNLDIHDIARSCFTFGIKKLFMINPLEGQKKFLERIMDFWKTEVAEKYNKDRVDAFSIVKYSESIEKSISEIINQEGVNPILVTTTALTRVGQVSISDFLNDEEKKNQPILLLFGTGNGLIDEIHHRADYVLKPIYGRGEYNHLSVRSAVAIILEKLTSEK